MHDIWNPWHGSLQSAQAAKSGLSHVGKPMN